MNRTEIFSFRVSIEEREYIALLARTLQRSQSDAVRYIVIKKAQEFAHLVDEPPAFPIQAEPQPVGGVD